MKKTSNALRIVIGSEAEGTAELFSMVDKFFDCLNVHNLTEAKVKIKPFRSPYRSGSDWRLKVSFLIADSLKQFALSVAQRIILGILVKVEEECNDAKER